MTIRNLGNKITEKFIIISSLCLIIFLTSSIYAQEKNQSTVKITLAGLKTDDGVVKIDVFNSEESWLKKSAYSYTAKIVNNSCEYTIENLPYGEYGVFVYQDKNSSGKMEMSDQGIPMEPFGYSKIVNMIMGPARWNDSKITINAPNAEIPIKVMMLEFGN
jgi:uncharacterized protein (DUF2141 family)